MQTGEGVVCDMYDTALLSDDMFAAHTTACYTFFNEVGEDTEDTENREDE